LGSEEIFSHGHGDIAVYISCLILELDVPPWFQGKTFVFWEIFVISYEIRYRAFFPRPKSNIGGFGGFKKEFLLQVKRELA
jgi:hypothetical protein